MQATTIKLDANLHASIRKLKPRAHSLTGYVRELIASEEKRHVPEAAADAYADLLASNKDEATWLAEWESAQSGSRCGRLSGRLKILPPRAHAANDCLIGVSSFELAGRCL